MSIQTAVPPAAPSTGAAPSAASAAAGGLDLIRPQPYPDWAPQLRAETAAGLRRELEQGAVLYFPELHFR
ncbi:hypothetical protein ABTK14_23445, partial [Acinetobacter baumannii]